jgi:hypothetical protein
MEDSTPFKLSKRLREVSSALVRGGDEKSQASALKVAKRLRQLAKYVEALPVDHAQIRRWDLVGRLVFAGASKRGGEMLFTLSALDWETVASASDNDEAMVILVTSYCKNLIELMLAPPCDRGREQVDRDAASVVAKAAGITPEAFDKIVEKCRRDYAQSPVRLTNLGEKASRRG